jgi:hypothetical protein
MKSKNIPELVFATGTLMSIAVSAAPKNDPHGPIRDSIHGSPIVMKFSDSSCQTTLEYPSISFTPPFDFHHIDEMIHAFYHGPSSHVRHAKTFKKPATELGSLYAGFRLEQETITLMFKAGAETFLNGTACEQDTNRSPLEQMLKEIKNVHQIKYEVNGKAFDDFDA